MDRRAFIASATLATLALAARPGAARSGTLASPCIIKRRTRAAQLAVAWPESSGGYYDSAAALARRIEHAFDGRLTLHLETRPGGAIDAIALKGADFCFARESDNVKHCPPLAYYAGLPGPLGLPATQHARWIEAGGGQKLWDACTAPFGIKPLLAIGGEDTGELWSRAPLNSVARQRIAAHGLSREVFAALGAQVKDAASLDVACAIERREIDAAQADALSQSMANGVTRAAAHVLSLPLLRSGSAVSFSIRRGLWERLSLSDRALLANAIRAHREREAALTRASGPLMRHLLRTGFGTMFREIDPDLALTIARVSEAVVADLAGGSKLARKINAAYMTYRSKVADPAVA